LNLSRSPFFLVFLLCLGSALCLPATASWALQAVDTSKPDSHSASTTLDNPQDEESGDDVYRHSASVQLLGRWLHLDKESAARLFEYLNFAILAGAVLYALSKYLPKTFRANRENIQHQLLDARTATQQAHERLAAIEQRLGRLDEEIAAISKQAEKDGVEDEARIKASIEEERRRIVDATSKDIAAAVSAAQRDLKRFTAGLAVDRAAQRIALTEDDDRGLLQEFVQSLGQHTQGRGES
jgi:F-type H+-transporting ATPase subunit b